MYGYVYLTTNMVNGKKYIGLHKSTKFSNSYKGSGKLLKAAFNKYGKDNFTVEILQVCDTKEELVSSELYYINLYNAKYDDNYYNLIDTPQPILQGIENGFFNKKHTEESKLKMSETRRLNIHTNGYGIKKFVAIINGEYFYNFIHIKSKYKFTNKKIKLMFGDPSYSMWNILDIDLHEEYSRYYDKFMGIKLKNAQAVGDRFRGVQLSTDHKNNISNSLKGMKHSVEWVNAINKNPEKIRKTAEKHRGMKRSEEAKAKMSAAKTGKESNIINNKLYFNIELKSVKFFSPTEIIPSGWKLGSGKSVYHCPVTKQNKLLFEWDIPEGWVRGRYAN